MFGPSSRIFKNSRPPGPSPPAGEGADGAAREEDCAGEAGGAGAERDSGAQAEGAAPRACAVSSYKAAHGADTGRVR